MKKNKWFLIILYVAAVILCIVLIYVVPSVAGLLENTYIAENGEIEISDEIEAYVVRDETVYGAGKACDVNRLAKSGDLVRAGTSIVELSGQGRVEMRDSSKAITEALGESLAISEAGATGVAGYVSYTVDGAEGKLCSSNIGKLTKEEYDSYCSSSTIKTITGKCAKNEPVFKITANGDWWLVFFTDEETAKRYEQDNNVRLVVGNENVSAYISSVKKYKSGDYQVVICCSVFVKNYLKARTMKAKVILKSASGLTLYNKSLCEKDNVVGVLVKNKNGDKVFTPVNVLADDGEKCIVSEDIFMDEEGNFVETIGIYDEIITSPSKSDIEKAGK